MTHAEKLKGNSTALSYSSAPRPAVCDVCVEARVSARRCSRGADELFPRPRAERPQGLPNKAIYLKAD